GMGAVGMEMGTGMDMVTGTGMGAVGMEMGMSKVYRQIKRDDGKSLAYDILETPRNIIAPKDAAAGEMLDEELVDLPQNSTDSNMYSFGRIGEHNVVVACLPAGQIGTNSAATVASQMRSSFPALRFGLLVGIGGGVPSNDNDIRLGDVVISLPTGQHGGVIQYDIGKTTPSGHVRTGSLNAPPQILLNALNKLRSNVIRRRTRLGERLTRFSCLPHFTSPGPDHDKLYLASSQATEPISRITRLTQEPVLFLGTIASGNQVMKDGTNDLWQPYAAATAAAYGKELLCLIPPLRGGDVDSWKEKTTIPRAAFQEIVSLTKHSVIKVSSLPYIGVPYIQNMAFFDRPHQLQRLHQILCANRSNVPSMVTASLVGPAGHGKTQIALQYIYLHINEYDLIMWCNAESRLKLAESISAHAQALKLISTAPSLPDDHKFATVARWLVASSSTVKWLLLFDNVEDFEVVRPLWPIAKSGSILITTRNSMLARLYTSQQVEIPLLTGAEGVIFLESFTSPPVLPHASEEERAIYEIVKRSGHLPLVLDLVRHHALGTGYSFAQFLRAHEQFEELLMNEDYSSYLRTEFYPVPLAATLTIGLEKTSPEARNIMSIIAFLDPDEIPVELFEITTTEMVDFGPLEPDLLPELSQWAENQLNDLNTRERALGEVKNRSLVTTLQAKRALRVHRMTQSAIAHVMKPSETVKWFNNAVLRLNVVFPWQEKSWSLYESWADCEKYAPHVAALIKAYAKLRSDVGYPITLCETIRRCSWYLFEKSEYEEASAMIDPAIRICEEAMSRGIETGYPNDWYIPRLVADLYSQKGVIAFAADHRGHGLEWHQKGREIRQQVLDNFDDEGDPDAMQIRRYDNNIANSLLAENMPHEALDLLQRVYTESKNSEFSSSEPSLLPLNLSLCYQELGRFDEAAQMLDEAYAIIEPAFGSEGQQMSS
ncbi:hypothetical protein EKO27_g10996, partial [Xylaria grammica]